MYRCTLSIVVAWNQSRVWRRLLIGPRPPAQRSTAN